MAEPVEKPVDLGLYPRAEPPQGLHATDLAGAALSIVWVIAVLSYMLAAPAGGEGQTFSLVMTLLVVFLPLALIWTSVMTMRTVRSLRAEAERLQAAVDAMRQAYVSAQQVQASFGLKPSVERKIDEIAAAARHTETTLATFASRREAAQPALAERKPALAMPAEPAPGDEQPALALGTPPEDMRAPLSVADFIRAMNFPDSPEDKDGFRALRRALEDRHVAKLIRAAQDVLTLLSQDGIYMDDLTPDRARPDVWRRFGAGERGRPIAALGGIRDRSSLALTAARMREDMVFRDVGSSRVDLQACKLEYSIVSPK